MSPSSPPYSHAPSFPCFQSPLPPVLTADAMREADRFTIDDYGIPSFTLMESAGRGAADSIEDAYGPLADQPIMVFCGKGNNGGDGLVVARRLFAEGAWVCVVTMSPPGDMRDDPAHNVDLLRQLKTESGSSDRLQFVPSDDLNTITTLADRLQPVLYVDALLGTGLTSALREPILSIVQWLNEQPEPVVALDVPTGLHSDTGAVLGATVVADHTVTMAALKVGLVTGEGPRVAGTIDVLDIGIPRFALDRVVTESGCARYTTDAIVQEWQPERAHDAHKYSVGMAVVVGGAPGFTGAPVMASLAAARAGAGYVTCACPASVQDLLSGKMTEIPTHALPESDNGINPEHALDTLANTLDKAKALLVGPGLGRGSDTERFVRALLKQSTLPAVIDADGLNALAGHVDDLAKRADGRWILTPHVGEFKRLAGSSVDLSDRIQVTQTYAQQWNSVLVLKGMPSIVGCPDGRAYINGTGNPALASAGTGDVLAGLCAGLLAQGLPPDCAAICALHLGGAAADRYAHHFDNRSMMALDMLDHLPHVLNERFSR